MADAGPIEAADGPFELGPTCQPSHATASAPLPHSANARAERGPRLSDGLVAAIVGAGGGLIAGRLALAGPGVSIAVTSRAAGDGSGDDGSVIGPGLLTGGVG